MLILKKKKLKNEYFSHVANWRCGNKPRGQLATWPIEHVTKILNR